MEAPTTAEIRAWSKADFETLDYPAPAEGSEDPDPLAVLVGRSIEYVLDVTGRTLETIPTTLEATAQEAIQRRVEQLAYQAQDDHVDTAADEVIDSFGAGSYNEKKRSPGDLNVRKSKSVNPWHLLHDLLWRLMTEEKREWWEEQMEGTPKPAFAVTEMDWGAGDLMDGRDPYLFGA